MNSQVDTTLRAVASPAALAPPELTPAQRFLGLITDALHTLQAMQEGCKRRPIDPESDELLVAVLHGGLQVTTNDFVILVFKRSAEKPSCNR